VSIFYSDKALPRDSVEAGTLAQFAVPGKSIGFRGSAPNLALPDLEIDRSPN
jgi:hypothetical protein